MEDIALSLPFSEESVDVQNYTASLLARCAEFNVIDSGKLSEIRQSLTAAFTETAEQFTRRESSSVSRKRAELIYSSVLYWSDVCLLSFNSLFQAVHTLKSCPMSLILSRGQKLILEIHSRNIEIFRKVYQTRLDVNCYEYRYVIEKSFDEYLKNYSARFDARSCGASIDYPLLGTPAYGLKSQGVMFINEYYGKILLENKFCRLFSPSALEAMLVSYGERYNYRYSEILFNISEIAAENLFANALLGRTDFEPPLSRNEERVLKEKYSQLSEDTVKNELCAAFSKYHSKIGNNSVYSYVAGYIPEFVKRLAN